MTRWQRGVTQKALRANQVKGFDCGFIATPDDMSGTMEPFTPCWELRYLGDGTAEWFDTLKEVQQWVREWGNS